MFTLVTKEGDHVYYTQDRWLAKEMIIYYEMEGLDVELEIEEI